MQCCSVSVFFWVHIVPKRKEWKRAEEVGRGFEFGGESVGEGFHVKSFVQVPAKRWRGGQEQAFLLEAAVC